MNDNDQTTGFYVYSHIINRAEESTEIVTPNNWYDLDIPEIGSLQNGIRAVRHCKAWGWTDYASLHTLRMSQSMLLGYPRDTISMIAYGIH